MMEQYTPIQKSVLSVGLANALLILVGAQPQKMGVEINAGNVKLLSINHAEMNPPESGAG